MFTAVFVNGADPKTYVGTYNDIVNFAEMDLENENNQEKVVRETYKNLGWENDEIESEIENLRNNFTLESTAKRHHKSLVKNEAKKLADLSEQAKIKTQQKEQYKLQYIQNVENTLREKIKQKSFDGIPVTQKIAEEVHDFLLVDKWKTQSGETLSDFDRAILDLKKPENHQTKVKLALLLKLMEKDPTLSTIQKVGISTQSNKLFDNLARQAKSTTTKSSGTNTGSFFG
jgi:hypothetical protein